MSVNVHQATMKKLLPVKSVTGAVGHATDIEPTSAPHASHPGMSLLATAALTTAVKGITQMETTVKHVG